MSASSSPDAVLRPAPEGVKGWLMTQALAFAPTAFAILRKLWPIAGFGSTFVVTLHDDVREVFGADRTFATPYRERLDVITGGKPFFLGIDDRGAHDDGAAAMRRVFRPDDLPGLGARAEQRAEAILAASDRRIEVVHDLVRATTFGLMMEYFGVPEPQDGRLDIWATRLFEFQFVGQKDDLALRREVDAIAPAFRTHLDREIARRKAAPETDDVLGRCLRLQGEGAPGFKDDEIRTGLLCMAVGGPPQPPMVLPQALEQLLRRPAALAEAAATARAGNDTRLHDIVLEAMRFDPLAPGLPRVAARDCAIARGTWRARTIPAGATVFVGFASAMMDSRRIPEPSRFDAGRRAHEYIHFGLGLHECFGRHINGAILHRILKPLLARPGLRRAPGPDGRLSKSGVFARRLVVDFDPAEEGR